MEESHIGVWRICHSSLNNLAGLALHKFSHIFQRLLEPAAGVAGSTFARGLLTACSARKSAEQPCITGGVKDIGI